MKSLTYFLLALMTLCFVGTGCSTTRGPSGLRGTVVQPNGEPLPFARVRVSLEEESGPSVEGYDGPPSDAKGLAVTTQDGIFEVTSLVDEAGESYELPRDSYLVIHIFKAEFHPWTETVSYEKGLLEIDALVYPDTIDIDDIGTVMDVGPDAEGGLGVTREGE